MKKRLTLSLLCLPFLPVVSKSVPVTDKVENALQPVEVGEARLGGLAGERADACISSRAYSPWARGVMYDEAYNSFSTHADDKTNGWQNEYWGKMSLCFAGAIAYTQDTELRDWVLEKTHGFLQTFQKENGYLSTYSDEDRLGLYDNLAWCFNIWGRKYTLWGLIELYRSTGDEQCLEAARKMGNHLVSQLQRLGIGIDQTGSWFGISSMSILRPMNELYRLTGDKKFLDLSRSIVTAMSATPSKIPTLLTNAHRTDIVRDWFLDCHYWAKAYEIQSCLEGLADYYRLTGDTAVLHGVEAFHRHLVAEEINPMRSAGYFDHFMNAAGRVNGMTELCDVTHWIRLNRELLLLTGDSRYADWIEEAFYNAFLAGVSRDGRWGAHIIRSHGSRHAWAPPQTGMNEHQCCPDNMMRTFFDVAGSMAARTLQNDVAVILYHDGVVELPDATLNISGGYPWGEAAVRVNLDAKKACKIRFRVPHWSKELLVNGELKPMEGGWCVADAPAGKSSWTLRFDMNPRLFDYESRVFDYEDYTLDRYVQFSNLTPEMEGMLRTSSGTQIFRGPLVLAKGKLAGTFRDDTFNMPSLYGHKDRSVSLEKANATTLNTSVRGCWNLTIQSEGHRVTVPVADYASLCDIDDATNWYSLWF